MLSAHPSAPAGGFAVGINHLVGRDIRYWLVRSTIRNWTTFLIILLCRAAVNARLPSFHGAHEHRVGSAAHSHHLTRFLETETRAAWEELRHVTVAEVAEEV
jgi:hypothetical protein